MSHAKPALALEVADAIRQGRLDDAEALLDELHALDPATRDLLVFPVVIAIQRGRVRDALQHLYTLDEDRCPELKALCLNLLGDPLWEGEARALLDHSPHPHVRRAMQQLLGLVPHEEPDPRGLPLAV
ncbi:MAG TPA: HrpB1 family type III secretion system apparatus protein [Burkholderiaceae bacterium]|nr:HrpB1 family type III secretion system apparatus protein [Burkholderiaceae bacterium]